MLHKNPVRKSTLLLIENLILLNSLTLTEVNQTVAKELAQSESEHDVFSTNIRKI